MTKTYQIDAFPNGYFMSWIVTTQAAFLVNAKLSDSATTYFQGSKQSMDIQPPLSQGASFVIGTNLELFIDIPQAISISNSINTYTITDNNGNPIGYGYTIFIEDGVDSDFNDVCISLIAWKTKG